MRKTIAAIALIAAAGLALTACGDDGTADDPAGGDTSAAPFNDADVEFAQDMIPHHQQAVQMAEMAGDRASSSEVKRLAADIEAAQGPEIEMMTQWLDDWGQNAPSESMDHDDMGHDLGDDSGEMPGMMDADELEALAVASGDRWDRMFLTMMIDHHEGAIEMAQAEQSDGENPDAMALAEQIVTSQQAEIADMEAMLDS